MDHPDNPSESSCSQAGEIQPSPEKVISFVVTDREDNPSGVLEKWNADAWIYAETDSLIDLN